MAPAGARERAHLSAYRAAGVHNGLGMQAFGPNGRNGIFAIDLEPERAAAAAASARGLRWACQAMHLRYCELLMRELGEVPVLSTREAEVLSWVARGKTNASIGGHPRNIGAHGGRAPPADLSSSSVSSTGSRPRSGVSASG